MSDKPAVDPRVTHPVIPPTEEELESGKPVVEPAPEPEAEVQPSDEQEQDPA